jgi:hypothetical protein
VKLSAGPQAKSKKKMKKGETNHSGDTWEKSIGKRRGCEEKKKREKEMEMEGNKRELSTYLCPQTNWDIV